MDSFEETYTLAHTARCKLQIAAEHPHRNLRFILGHAFTLDKLRFRLAEIEESSSSDEDLYFEDDVERPTNTGHTHEHTHTHNHPTDFSNDPVPPPQRRVSFTNNVHPDSAGRRARSPPPPPTPQDLDTPSTSDSDSDDEAYDDYDDEGTLGLERFGSAAAIPPRLVDDDGEDDEDNAGPKSPTEDELRVLCEGEGDRTLLQGYNGVLECPCHGLDGKAPVAEKMWEVPGHGAGKRVAVVQIAA